MGTITFIQPDQTRSTIVIKPGNTVMESAVASEVPGIEAQCYGAGICGTCHVYAGEAVRAILPAPTQWEQDMLANLELAREGSRLACQLRFAEAMEGAEFTVPERQEAAS